MEIAELREYYGKGKNVLLSIFNELKNEIEDRYFEEEDTDYEYWFSELLKKIESNDSSIFDDLKKSMNVYTLTKMFNLISLKLKKLKRN